MSDIHLKVDRSVGVTTIMDHVTTMYAGSLPSMAILHPSPLSLPWCVAWLASCLTDHKDGRCHTSGAMVPQGLLLNRVKNVETLVPSIIISEHLGDKLADNSLAEVYSDQDFCTSCHKPISSVCMWKIDSIYKDRNVYKHVWIPYIFNV